MLSRPDAVSAAVTARAQGSRVEVTSERTGTSTTWANPDGSSTTEQHAGPIRVRDAAGAWRDVDLGLVQDADGSVAPPVHPVDLKLSGPTTTADVSTVAVTTSPASDAAASAVSEKSAPASSRTSGARQSSSSRKITSQKSAASATQAKPAPKRVSVGWGWPGRLPRPVIEKGADQNDKVRYRGVQPGVDLVVQVLRTGYEQYFEVQSAAALAGLKAKNNGTISWSLPINTGGLTARLTPAGAVELVDAQGKVSWTYAAPLAWDAGIDRASGERTSTAAVSLSLATPRKGLAVVTVTPDQAWMSDSARQFPITVDPYAAGSVAPSFDAFVQSDYINTDNSRSTELKVGTYNGGAVKARSFINFPTSSIRGKQIKSASLSLY
ncbi:MAG: DNRLRE domain-containing protein, partial [Angustibacter sp.]